MTEKLPTTNTKSVPSKSTDEGSQERAGTAPHFLLPNVLITRTVSVGNKTS